MKKFLTIFLATAMLALFGCENVSYTEEKPQEQTSTDIFEQIQSQLPPAVAPDDNGNIQRQPFVIVTDDATAFYQSETAPSAISAALEERNTFLRDTYGAEISVKEVTEEQIISDLKTAVANGTSYCDMISVSAETTVKLYKEGLLEDINTLPSFNLENGLFDEKLAKSLATNNSLYMIADPSALIYNDAYVLFYNRDLLPEGTDLEVLVMNGEWTWDKFDEISRAAANKVYSQSGADINNDIFAFSAYRTETVYPLTMWASCGRKIIDNTYKSPVGVSMESEEIIEIADKLMSIYNVKGKFPLEGEDAAKAFEENRLAFFCHELSYLYNLRDGSLSGNNYGFVPLPKYNTEQEGYNCLLSNDARVISVPKTMTNADEAKRKFVATTISALCASGSDTVNDAYINSLLAVYLNSNSELVMIDTICSSVTFDFATVYGSSINEIARPTINAIADYLDYGSRISSSLRQGKQAFENYCAQNFT